MVQRKITVFIYLLDETVAVPAGIFTYDADTGVGSFAYGRKYQERPNALPVDPLALPIGPRPREVVTNGGIYGAFRDASPDYWGRLIIAAEGRVPPEAFSEIDCLLAANATRVGNLDFRISPEAPEPELSPPHFDQLADVMLAAEKIERGEETNLHFLQLLRQGTSMGGARPKCTVEWDDALWIAKFPARGDSLNMPRVEYATITLAARCGIRTPEIRLVTVGGKDIFLSRRFDREKVETGWKRRGFVSSLSLMQWDERDRVRWDYVAIADTMRQQSAAQEIEELFRRMIFNILVRNCDDHPRNHGFLVESPSRLSLSPAYDIVPSLANPGVGTDFRLAMSVGAQGREASIGNALSSAVRFGLPDMQATAIVEQLLLITKDWSDHFAACGVSDGNIELLRSSFAGGGRASFASLAIMKSCLAFE